MSKTLKELQEQKLLNNKKIVDEILVNEAKFSLLKESIDDESLEKVGEIVDKLKKIKSPKLPVLTKAIEQAENDINKYTGGGVITKALSKLKDVVGIDNPIVKVTTFANSLEQGFLQFPKILKNNSIDIDQLDDENLEKTLSEFINASSEIKNKTTTSKNILNQMQKAITPKGVYAIFKKIPYIKSEDLVQELINTPIKVFVFITNNIKSGTKTSDVTDDIADDINNKGDVESKQTEKSKTTQQTSGTKLTTGTDNSKIRTTGTTSTGEKPVEPRGGSTGPMKKAYATIKNANLDIDDEKLKKIIKLLKQNNQLK